MFLYGILFVFLIFAQFFEENMPGLNYWDEIITILILLVGIFKCLIKKRIEVNIIKLWIPIKCFVALGLFGNILHPGIQYNNSIIFRDILASIKFLIVVYALRLIKIDSNRQKRITRLAANISKLIIVVTFVIAVITYPMNTYFYTGEIRLVKCFRFVFGHPTFFVSSYVILTGILIADNNKKNRVFIIFNCILLFLAQRDKGYIAILMALVIVFLGETKCTRYLDRIVKSSPKSIWRFRSIFIVIAMGIIAFLIGKEKIFLYFQWGMSAARPALYVVGVRIAFDYFPFGSGFGTFASTLSVRNYSNIYDIYNISKVLGLSREYSAFVGDVFWPYVYGQFGMVGFLLYLKMIYDIIKYQLTRALKSSERLALIFLWVYIIVASTAEAFFTNSTGIEVATIMGIFIGYNYERKEDYDRDR